MKPNNQKPAEPQQLTTLIRLASLCLTGLLAGVNDIIYLPPPEAASLESSLLSSACTILPFTVACILAAAFVDTLVRCSRLPPSSMLALASLLIAGAHASALALPSPWSQTVPWAVLWHLVLGVGNMLSFTLATLLCRGGRTKLGVFHGTVALGVVLRTAMAATDTVESRAILISGRKGQHLAVLLLALATAASLLLTPRPDRHRAGKDGKEVDGTTYQDAEAQAYRTPQPAPPPAPATRPEQPLLLETSAQYPAPASRTTILAALLALAYHAAVVAIPTILVSLSVSVNRQRHTAPLTSQVTAALWTGIALGRFFSIPRRREQQIRSKSKQLVSRTVFVVAGGFLLLSSCWPFSSWGIIVDHVTIPAAAGLFGIALGPVYPWAVRVLICEMDEGEAVGGVGIVVAFGYAGEMFALLMVQLVAHLDAPVVLYVVIAGLVGGMLVCWTALMGDEDGETGTASGVDV